MSANNIIAYTDGSFRKKLNAGGWSAVIINDNITSEFYQGGVVIDSHTTELKAVILAIENTPINSNVTIYSDSVSLVDVIQSRINEKETPSKNRDLWKHLTEIMSKRNVSCVWIKGHSGIKENVRADQLAYQALLENYPCDKVVEELLYAKIPTKYKEKNHY